MNFFKNSIDKLKKILQNNKSQHPNKNKEKTKKTVIIINPKAGKHIFLNLIVEIVKAQYNQNNIEYEIIVTKKEGEATKIAKFYSDIVDFYTIMGGDGTIREVIEGMMHNPKPIGIIPTGTANVLAIDIGIPFFAKKAVQNIINGKTKKIDLGLLNDKPFLLMASSGIDALAVHNVNLKIKKIFGKLTYIFSAVKSFLTYKPHKITVDMPDINVKEQGYLAIISNSRFYGGKFQIDSNTYIDDGLLNVFIFKKGSFKDTIRLFFGILTKTHSHLEDCTFYKSSKILIHSEKNVHMQIDGDRAPFPPAVITVKKQYLTIFVE